MSEVQLLVFGRTDGERVVRLIRAMGYDNAYVSHLDDYVS